MNVEERRDRHGEFMKQDEGLPDGIASAARRGGAKVFVGHPGVLAAFGLRRGMPESKQG